MNGRLVERIRRGPVVRNPQPSTDLMIFFRAAAWAVLVSAYMALPLAAQRAGLAARMEDLRRSVRSDQRDSVASFFPQRGSWSWVQTVLDSGGNRVVAVGRWRFSAAEARRAIGEGGPLCESFEPEKGGYGPYEGLLGMRLSLESPWDRPQSTWRHVGTNRFVPPGEPDHSRIFVEWRREEGRWVISSIGDETLYFPRVLGRRIVHPEEVQRTATVSASGYTTDAEWLIVLDGFRYTKYGLPRQLSAGDIELVGAKGNVPVYVARGDTREPEVLYVPTDASHFQPYQVEHGRSVPCR